MHEKWKRDFPEDIFHKGEWQKLYGMAFLASRETKIQPLQFKIIHRIIPCRDYLFKRKIVDTPEWLSCGATDNLVHFFITCPTVREFIGRIKIWISNVLEYDVVELSDKDYLLGLVESGENSRTINYIFFYELNSIHIGSVSFTMVYLICISGFGNYVID